MGDLKTIKKEAWEKHNKEINRQLRGLYFDLKALQGLQGSRELSLVITKIEEAHMWMGKVNYNE